MEYLLDFADDHVLDKAYAYLLPAKDFLPSSLLKESVSAQLSNTSTTSTLASFASTLYKNIPHPPVDLTTAFTSSVASAWPRDYIPRQFASLYLITLLGIVSMYFSVATLSYYFIFNHEMMNHPRFIKGQVAMEIKSSCIAFPWITLMTVPWFVAECRGGGGYYDRIEEYGVAYAILSVPLFLLFTDTAIYWIHRIEHHPLIYKHVHKPHHKWIIPTPFASHAFHPLDGYVQSVPYHLFPALFPLHKKIYLGLFTAVNFWSIFIHDSDMVTGSRFEKIINGPAHHTLHHLYFTVNYGQYFTLSDRLGNSYRQPAPELDPMHEINKRKEKELLEQKLKAE